MPFIRVYRPLDNKEILVNTDHISRIEVEYVVLGKNNVYFKTSIEEGLKNPAAVRMYNIFVGGERFVLYADSDDPVKKEIEKIYKNAIKK